MSDKQAVTNDALSGSNIIKINQDTMQQAIEYWLNNVVLRKPVTVSSVKEVPNAGMFEIHVLTEAQP